MFYNICAKNDSTFDSVNTSDISLIKSHIKPQTKAVFIEAPTNPVMQVTDIAAVSQLAKKHGLLVIVDNTF